MNVENPFKIAQETGTLIHHDSESGEFDIWFPYTKQLVRTIKKGVFVGVENFESDDITDRYSLLEIMEAHPEHYALGSSKASIESSYPGFVVEAAKSARLDWEQEEPEEHTTVIVCKASRSGKEMQKQPGGGIEVGEEDALPMIGQDAYLLSNDMMKKVINEDILESGRDTISPGELRLDDNIPYHLEIENLLKTHFGIFGFTGAGKSNLLSTMVAEILENGSDETIVFSDLMGEYTSLLIDLIDRYEDAVIVSLEPESLPGGDVTREYIEGESDNIERAAASISNGLLLPRELEPHREDIMRIMASIIEDEKLLILSEEGLTGGDLIEEFEQNMSHSSGSRSLVESRIRHVLPDDEDEELDEGVMREIHRDMEIVIEHDQVPTDPQNWGRQQTASDAPPRFASNDTESLSPTESGDIRGFTRYVQSVLEELASSDEGRITREEIYNMINSSSPSLIILQSDYGDNLKNHTSHILNNIYRYRRSRGENTPLVSFVFDEADEFIPSGQVDDSTYRIRETIEQIARRGRKFGIGIGIATQRSTYLETNIMAQPHTYMISKLPRQEDRQTVGNAFGLSSDVLDRTLEFNTGEWLTVSFEAAGISGFPIPVKFHNANERIIDYVTEEGSEESN